MVDARAAQGSGQCLNDAEAFEDGVGDDQQPAQTQPDGDFTDFAGSTPAESHLTGGVECPNGSHGGNP